MTVSVVVNMYTKRSEWIYNSSTVQEMKLVQSAAAPREQTSKPAILVDYLGKQYVMNKIWRGKMSTTKEAKTTG